MRKANIRRENTSPERSITWEWLGIVFAERAVPGEDDKQPTHRVPSIFVFGNRR